MAAPRTVRQKIDAEGIAGTLRAVPRPGRWCLLAALALAPAAASAQDLPVALTWRAPPTCPAREVVLTRVGQLRAAQASPRLDATATVTRRPDARWRVRIETPSGVRVLQARDCAQLAEATAVVLALALDDLAPTPVLAAARPTLPASVEQVSDVERPPALRPAPPPPRPAPVALRAALVAGVGFDARALPGGAWSAGLAAVWTLDALRVEISPSVAGSVGDGAFDGLRLTAMTRACVVSGGVARLGLCAAFVGGWLRVRARDVDLAADGNAPWAAFGASLLARLGGPRVAAVVTLDAFAPVARPRFVVRGGDAWEVPAFTVALGLGAELTLR